MIKIGQKVQFNPYKATTGFASEDFRTRKATGIVVYINWQNKWFLVEYDCGGVKQRASFKFSQIGKDVMLCG